MKTRVYLLLIACALGACAYAVDPQILQVQNRLYKLGYPPGPIDGRLGPRTRSAIEYFQGDHDIPQTGSLDRTTLAMLKLSKEHYEAPTPALRLQAYLKERNYYSGTIDGLIGRRTWRAIQAYLRDQGHYSGNIDGIAGPITRTAVAAWQKSLGVEQSKVIDGETVAALMGTPVGQN